MKTFHIVYYEDNGDLYSKGVNIEAKSMLEAINIFLQEYKVEPYFVVEK